MFLGSTGSLNRIGNSDIGFKSLEELVLIRKTLAAQALKLRGLEINLHRVLSKVVLLADAGVQAPGRYSSKEDPLAVLSERLNLLLERLNQEERISTNLLELKEWSTKVCQEPSPSQTLPKELTEEKDEPKVGKL